MGNAVKNPIVDSASMIHLRGNRMPKRMRMPSNEKNE